MPYSPPPADPHAASARQAAPAGAPPPAGGLAVASLIVGIIAALTGWVPIVGLIIGTVGVVLGILAIRISMRRGFGITGVVLSGLAVLTNIVIILISLTLVPAMLADRTGTAWQIDGGSQVDGGASAGAESLSGQSVTTPLLQLRGAIRLHQ